MSPKILKELVAKSLKSLNGDWVIIGGTVLPLVGIDSRVTFDIDMIPVKDSGNESMLELMELASSIGLPIETINAAGLFFLKKIPDWRERLEIHAQSKKCRILRPNFDLYLELKIARFSESDELDILAYFEWYKENKLYFDSLRSIQILQLETKKNKDQGKKHRLNSLQKFFGKR